MSLLGLLAAGVAEPLTVPRAVGRHASLQWTSADLTLQPSGTWRTRLHIERAATSIQIGYGNTYFHGPGPAPFTMEAVLESVDGSQVWPVTWDGAGSRTLEPDEVATSDPITGLTTTGPTDLFWRVHFTGPTVVHAGGGSPTSSEGEGTTYYSGGTKNLTGPFAPSPTGIMRPVPRFIYGATSGSPRTLALVGDSTLAAGGDAASWAVRACIRDGVPYLLRAIGGTTMADLADDADFARWFGHGELEHVDHVLLALGRNDAGDPRPNIGAVLARIRDVGFTGQVVLCTVSPSTTSTDGWATTANQAANGSDAGRLAYNAWVRDGAPVTADGALAAPGSVGDLRAGDVGHPCTGGTNPHPAYLDVADMVESARNSGRWKPGWTADGLHPSETGTLEIVAMTPTIAT